MSKRLYRSPVICLLVPVIGRVTKPRWKRMELSTVCLGVIFAVEVERA